MNRVCLAGRVGIPETDGAFGKLLIWGCVMVQVVIGAGDSIVFVVILAVGAFIALIAWGNVQRRKRREALAAWAMQQGLSFTAERDHGVEDRYPEFKALRQGSNRYAFNIMQGTWRERGFLGFDYHYETQSTDSKGNSSTHHHQFSAVIVSSDVPLKPLLIRPEGFFDRIGSFFGFDDIDFESAEFSKRFFVKAEDRRWAYDVIHARTMDFLLSAPRYTIQFDRGHVIASDDRTFDPGQFEAAAGVVHGVLDALPDYVVEQQRARG